MSNIIVRAKQSTQSGILTTEGTLFAQNTARVGMHIQNLDTDPLFVKFGATASATDFDFILSGGTGADDGKGGSYTMTGDVCYTGIVTVAQTTPRFCGSQLTVNNNAN